MNGCLRFSRAIVGVSGCGQDAEADLLTYKLHHISWGLTNPTFHKKAGGGGRAFIQQRLLREEAEGMHDGGLTTPSPQLPPELPPRHAMPTDARDGREAASTPLSGCMSISTESTETLPLSSCASAAGACSPAANSSAPSQMTPARPASASAEQCLLFFGCRRRDQDYLYGNLLERWQQQHVITLFTAFSREQASLACSLLVTASLQAVHISCCCYCRACI